MAEINTASAFAWEGKHTRALIVCVFAIIIVFLFHRQERKFMAAGLGVAAAILGFL